MILSLSEKNPTHVHAPQVEKAETEIKRLRGLNDMFEKDLEKLRGEMESAHTRRKVCIVIVLKIHKFMHMYIRVYGKCFTSCVYFIVHGVYVNVHSHVCMHMHSFMLQCILSHTH